jgi:hypothetical protein
MDGTTSQRLATRAASLLLVLAAACFAMPLAVLPSGPTSGLALAGGGAGPHPEAAVALGLVLVGAAVSPTRLRHRLAVLVQTSGFATTALLLLRATVSTTAQDAGDRFAATVGAGPQAFGPVGGALQQALAVRWTAAYWTALLCTAAVFAVSSWALLRQPAPSRRAASRPAPGASPAA